jgi:hypothetical protein
VHTQRIQSAQARKREWENQELERRRAISARSENKMASIEEARERAARLTAVHERAKPWMTLVEMGSRLSLIKVLPTLQHAFCLCFFITPDTSLAHELGYSFTLQWS